jgi:hypothetical protein
LRRPRFARGDEFAAAETSQQRRVVEVDRLLARQLESHDVIGRLGGVLGAPQTGMTLGAQARLKRGEIGAVGGVDQSDERDRSGVDGERCHGEPAC